MATLSTQDRTRIWRGLMRYVSATRDVLNGITKPDLQAAVNAADSNASAFNTALPTTFRNNATPAQKALLLAVVVLMRYDPELLKALIGEID